MSSVFDFDRPPDRYAVMGNPVAHSKSPRIHSEFARQTGQRIEYTAIQVDLGGFAQAVGNFHSSGGRGLNVTIPFKHDAWRLADSLSPRAQRAEAVNTLVLNQDGSRFGDNTDGCGLVRDILDNHGGIIAARRVLVVGAGGAVQGIVGALLDEHPAKLVVANRTESRAHELAARFREARPIEGCGLPDLAGQQFDLIINGTAASLHGGVPALPEDVLAPGGWCYDLMYSDQPTPFVQWGQAHGAEVSLDGLGMLVEQAAESFHIWRQVRPDTRPVIALLRREQNGRR